MIGPRQRLSDGADIVFYDPSGQPIEPQQGTAQGEESQPQVEEGSDAGD